MQIGVLGPAVAVRGGVEQDLGAAKQRALLAVLALHLRESVNTSTIVEALWGDRPPPSETVTLQGYVYALRKVLEPDRAPRMPATVLVTTHSGYALKLPDDALDAGRLEAAVKRASRHVLTAADRPWQVATGDRDELADAGDELDVALAAWRGDPYAELIDFVDADAERTRLVELRITALELRAAIHLALGGPAAAIAVLEGVTTLVPHRERPWMLLAVALVRSGRQVEALDALRAVRETLRDELGIDPSQAVRDLESAILNQHESLHLAQAPVPQRTARLAPEPDPWPFVGRGAQLAELDGALLAVAAGVPQFVQLIGEPGIGKSRLLRELRRRAADQGFVCAEAFCSQDEGAPPLWPWVALLDSLATQTGVEVPDLRGTEGSQFALWEAIAGAVHAAAEEHPVLLTVDDIHWADPSTVRALRHLVDVSARGRLMIATARRPHPAPVGAQAALADAFARRHCLRIDLAGLDDSASTQLLSAVMPDQVTDASRLRLLERAEGNPFFLVELARAGESVPGSVRDVVARRIGELPLGTRDLLAMAAVLGRRFRLDALARAEHLDEADAVDQLLPAIEAGLVLDAEGHGALRFSHPLVQDVVVGRVPAVRAVALHARAAATLAGLPDVPASDLARHWRQAGPQHAAECAAAAERAAADARVVAAHEEEVELLGWAIEARGTLAGTDDRTLYDLEMARARAARWGGQWADAEACVAQAVALADRMDDHEALARAALSTVEGAVWYSNAFGDVNAFIVDTLERVLAGLPPGDSELRCRVLLSLGIELYFSPDPDRVTAYIDDAVDMARRLDDAALLQAVLHGACFGNWRPGSAPYRVELAREAVELADTTGDRRALALALAGLASALAEVGDVHGMWPVVDRGLAVAAELNLTAVTVFLEAMRLPWLVMAGHDDPNVLPRLRELAGRFAIPNVAAALAHTALVTGQSDDAPSGSSDDERVLEEAAVPTASAHAVVCVRRGDLETARRIVASHRDRFVAEHHDFMSMMRWCYGAELGLALGDLELAAHADAALAPYSGRSCSAAQIGADGPVDVYRALAAAALGDTARAREIADAAARQCVEWDVPRAGERLAGYRRSYGF